MESNQLNTENVDLFTVAYEFGRLAQRTALPEVAELLNYISDALFATAGTQYDPGLVPCGVKSPTQIQTVNCLGAPASIWWTNDFRNRLRFLRTGQIMIVYPNVDNITPLIVRADPSNFANWKNE